MDEIQNISREINFMKFKGPFNTFKQKRDGDKTLQEIEEDEKMFKSSLGEITSGNPELCTRR